MVLALDARAAQIFSAQGLRWPGLWIISGHRSPSRQLEVNPSVPNSLHTRCPSMAVDLRVGNLPASTTAFEVWGFLGGIWKSLGGRWGGNFRTPDPNHFEEISVPFLDDVQDPVAPSFRSQPILIATRPPPTEPRTRPRRLPVPARRIAPALPQVQPRLPRFAAVGEPVRVAASFMDALR